MIEARADLAGHVLLGVAGDVASLLQQRQPVLEVGDLARGCD